VTNTPYTVYIEPTADMPILNIHTINFEVYVTLLTLLLVMALERVTTKSKQFHIATLAERYFGFLFEKKWLSADSGMSGAVLLALVPALICYVLLSWLPIFFVFLANIVVVWVCLGCPVTRKTYKQYLQAAHREDFQACALHSMSFGNEGGELSNVGKQLVLVNYRQYAAVVIFFISLGAPGVIFYSLVKEWALHLKRERVNQSTSTSIDAEQVKAEPFSLEHGNLEHQSADEEYIEDSSAQAEVSPIKPEESDVNRLLFIIDWLPVRITTFGFLVVGHFTHAMSAWFEILLNPNIPTYDALAKVSKAAEDVSNCDSHLNEPLQLVRLVKRNIIFLLMAVSLLTMVGLVA